MHMREREVVASIAADGPERLAQAYDRYADPLYKYCRSMLGNPADAADAVQDTFVIATSRLDGVREPERLRAWLYAVARNECLRVPRPAKPAPELDGVQDATDEVAGVGEDAERAKLRALLRDAVGGLSPAEREVIELQLRQGLEPAEVAAVLGVSARHAHSLLTRARNQLEACLGVLLASRAGREECGRLAGLLTGWDGRLTVPLRKRVGRHIERCPTCFTRRAFELRPARPASSTPRQASSWLRARVSSECAWLRDTPSTAATSAGSRPCRSCSSMTSRSVGFRPPAASSSRPRSSARSVSSPTSGAWSATSGASSRADVGFLARRMRRHSFRATAYSQARSRSGSRSPASRDAAMTNVSWTASAASAGSLSMDRQYL